MHIVYILDTANYSHFSKRLSCNVIGLYPSIPHNNALQILFNFYQTLLFWHQCNKIIFGVCHQFSITKQLLTGTFYFSIVKLQWELYALPRLPKYIWQVGRIFFYFPLKSFCHSYQMVWSLHWLPISDGSGFCKIQQCQ